MVVCSQITNLRSPHLISADCGQVNSPANASRGKWRRSLLHIHPSPIAPATSSLLEITALENLTLGQERDNVRRRHLSSSVDLNISFLRDEMQAYVNNQLISPDLVKLPTS